MVTFNNVGRFGNFMFQCANAISYARKHNLELTVPVKSPYWPLYFQHLINKKYRHNLPKIDVYEQGHQYQEIPFKEEWRNKNIVLNGYWQSEKYFKECREDILKAFNIPWKLDKDFVSIHIRRGDYLHPGHLDKHPICSMEYYLQSIELFACQGYNRFVIFSDDMVWCKQHFNDKKFAYVGFYYSEGKTPLEDLSIMSSCEHNIAANSSYSWWGSWVNQNPDKITIFPKMWFGPSNQHLSTESLYPENAIIL